MCLGQPGDLRGGSWINNRDNARAAYRNNNNPNNRNNNNGFRLVVRCPTTYSFPFEGRPPSLRFSDSPALSAGCWIGTRAVAMPMARRFQYMPADHGLRDAAREGYKMAQVCPACTLIGW